MTNDRALYRIPDEGMISGVCAGLARYFGIDESVVRAAFVGSTVLGGFGLVAYVTLWLLLEEAQSPDPVEDGRPIRR